MNEKTIKPQTYEIDAKKICSIILISYICLSILFYFLAGHQLHFRTSKGNVEISTANSGTVELVSGSKIEQIFTPEIQHIQKFSIQWGTFGRKNAGSVIVEILNLNTNSLLLSQTIDASKISEGEVIQLSAVSQLEGLYNVPLMIRITSPDSIPGSAVSPLMNTNESTEDYSLFLNGKQVNGKLCFSVIGEDNIWFGLHYWKFAVGFGLILLAYLIFFNYKVKNGKKSLLFNAIVAVKKYKFLIQQLISRDFKTKYKRSILGVLWSFLNPLLMMLVQYVVFSTIFKSDIKNYPVYLLTGIVMFNYFSEACGLTLTSILTNASLITKVYVPKYIYPISRVLSSAVNLLISIIPLLLVVIFTGVKITPAYALILFSLICLVIFCIGLGMLLSSAMVFFRDTQFIWSVFSMMWMYSTPIFYPESILPEQFKGILTINPMYYFIQFTRTCILNGVSPEPVLYMQCALFAFGMLIIGAFVFKKSQDKFILYI